MNPITIRKTLARFAYYVSQTQSGITHDNILKALDLSQEEFDYLIDSCIKISNSNDYDLKIVSVDKIFNYPIGGTEIINDNDEIVAYL